MQSEQLQSAPTYFRYFLRLLNRFPNFDHPRIGRLRGKAVHLLRLSKGSRVLDVGCGPGASFPYLLAAVGHPGEVLGVEISPEVAATAQKRIEANHWPNVRVVIGDGRTVALQGKFDGLMLFGAPDIYASVEALVNLRPYLNDGARVVAFGAKLTGRRFGRALNVLLKSLMRFSFVSTPKLNFAPWAPLQAYCVDFQVHEYLYGCFSGIRLRAPRKRKRAVNSRVWQPC